MSWDYYNKEWSEVKPNIPFKQLPMLVIDKKHEICQSMAIMTFIENLAGINITDPILNAKANAIMQSAQELFMPLNPTVNFAIGEKFIKKKDDMMPFLLSRFEDLEKAMKNNDKKFLPGLVVIGSYVELTTIQLKKFLEICDCEPSFEARPHTQFGWKRSSYIVIAKKPVPRSSIS